MCNEKRKEECNGLGVVVGEIFGGGLFWGGRLWLWVLSGPLVAKVALHRVSWGPRGGCNGIPRGKKHQIHAVSAEMSSQKCPPRPAPEWGTEGGENEGGLRWDISDAALDLIPSPPKSKSILFIILHPPRGPKIERNEPTTLLPTQRPGHQQQNAEAKGTYMQYFSWLL